MATRRTSKKKKAYIPPVRIILFCSSVIVLCMFLLLVTTLLQPQDKTPPESPVTVTAPEKPEATPAAQKQENQKSEQKPVSKPEPKQEQKPVTKSEPKTEPHKTESPAQKPAAEQKQETKAAPRTEPKAEPAQPKSEPKAEPAQPKSEPKPVQPAAPKPEFNFPQAKNGATVVIIIDDAGRSVENTKKYTALPFPITIAVLPKLPQSRACADAIRAAGKEVILHQPMQATNLNLDPGPGAIKADMTSSQISAIIRENLAELGPGVKGLNNHEGSLITANEIKIGAVLDVCAELNVYFLDSRTTIETKAPQAALERDMHIFEKAGPYLDNDIDREKMLARLYETLTYANNHGRAIVIGHVDKSVRLLPALLADAYPELKAAGYQFATPSMLR